MALAISFAFFIGATLAESLAIWPLPTNEFTTTTGREITSGTAFWYADVVFVVLLLFGHNLTRFCRSEPIVFLDKCCINQSCAEKKTDSGKKQKLRQVNQEIRLQNIRKFKRREVNLTERQPWGYSYDHSEI